MGQYFVERVDLVFERITEMPEVNALVHRDLRRAIVGHFAGSGRPMTTQLCAIIRIRWHRMSECAGDVVPICSR